MADKNWTVGPRKDGNEKSKRDLGECISRRRTSISTDAFWALLAKALSLRKSFLSRGGHQFRHGFVGGLLSCTTNPSWLNIRRISIHREEEAGFAELLIVAKGREQRTMKEPIAERGTYRHATISMMNLFQTLPSGTSSLMVSRLAENIWCVSFNVSASEL
jgi:hypothetical protein